VVAIFQASEDAARFSRASEILTKIHMPTMNPAIPMATL
jgi:hypothetical protein